MKKHITITCGPAWEPIDRMRRITNASTGELGILLAKTFARAGHTVTVFKGEGATTRLSAPECKIVPFTTNDDLLAKLQAHANHVKTHALLHCAALCDYKVKAITAANGTNVTAKKIPTRAGEITLTLAPAAKILPKLRRLFPNATIIGWKYELDGTPATALDKARAQIATCHTDGCVVNGTAWGDGFALVDSNFTTPAKTRPQLCKLLLTRVGIRV